jgi:hypothetical protein
MQMVADKQRFENTEQSEKIQNQIQMNYQGHFNNQVEKSNYGVKF